MEKHDEGAALLRSQHVDVHAMTRGFKHQTAKEPQGYDENQNGKGAAVDRQHGCQAQKTREKGQVGQLERGRNEVLLEDKSGQDSTNERRCVTYNGMIIRLIW